MVVGLGIIGLAGFYFIAKTLCPAEQAFHALIGLGFGCSLMSVFARIAGGIYTKAADVGADLVGKVEQKSPKTIPETLPLSPTTLATTLATAQVWQPTFMRHTRLPSLPPCFLQRLFSARTAHGSSSRSCSAAVSIIASIIGTYFVRLGKNDYIMGALYKGLGCCRRSCSNSVLFRGQVALSSDLGANAGVFTPNTVFFISLIGLALTGLIVWITEYFTAKEYPPVKHIAQASLTGHGTNVIAGLAVSMKSTAAPVLVIVASILGAYWLRRRISGQANAASGGIFAIALVSGFHALHDRHRRGH